MDEDLQNIEDLFKLSLEDNEEMPSKKVWDGIDHRLDNENMRVIKRKYHAVKRLAFLLLLLLSGFSLYELNNRYGKNSLVSKNDENINKENKNSMIVKEPGDSVTKYRAKINSDNNTVVISVHGKNKNNLRADNDLSSYKKNNLVEKSFSFNHSKTLSGKHRTKIKIKNGEATIENQPAVESNIAKVNTALPTLQQLTNVVFEKINMPERNPAIINKIIPFFIENQKTFAAAESKIKIKNPINKSSRFSITGFFSADIASYNLKNDNILNQPENATEIKKNERHEFSSTTGMLVEYQLNKHWALQSGITFSNINIALNPKTIYARGDNNGAVKYRLNFSSGYGYLVPSFQPNPSVGDSLNVTATTHKLRYIGIPVAVKYQIVKGKFIIEAMAGVRTNFLTMGKLETEIQKGPDNEIDILNKIEGLKSVYFSGTAGIGVEYKFTHKFSFVLMPTVTFALNPINEGTVVKTSPNSTGLITGLKFNF